MKKLEGNEFCSVDSIKKAINTNSINNSSLEEVVFYFSGTYIHGRMHLQSRIPRWLLCCESNLKYAVMCDKRREK